MRGLVGRVAVDPQFVGPDVIREDDDHIGGSVRA